EVAVVEVAVVEVAVVEVAVVEVLPSHHGWSEAPWRLPTAVGPPGAPARRTVDAVSVGSCAGPGRAVGR
ncbi:hypothetical protein, partial [Streptomyces arboris]